MGKSKKILWVLLFILLGVVGYCFRWTFSYKFDPVYWENFYYTSQWNVPNSKREISDEGVYRYIGYRLVNGENPFNVDYWVPPLGKYWYGMATKYLGNPYWASWGWYVILLILVWGITKNLWVLLLVATNPLVVAQIGMTMLDLPQGVLLLAQVGCLLSGHFVLAGLMLGLMMGIKIGIFGPMVTVVGIYYLYKKTKSKKEILMFLLAIPVGYMLAYTCYFLAHPNPIPWLRLHGKIVEFWRNSGAVAHPLNILGYILIDKFNQVWGGDRIWMTVKEWSILFPISILIMIKKWINPTPRLGNRVPPLDKGGYYLLLASGWIGMCTLIDFWPRYLVAIVPVLAIITVDFLKNKKGWLILILMINALSLVAVLQTKPTIDEPVNIKNEKIVTIVNPVRNRELWKDKSLAPIETQYGAINKLNLAATWLIQDDVFFDKELVDKIKSIDEKQELGLFLEVSKGLALRARVYFDEQRPWYDPGVVFLSGYSVTDRKKIIDTVVADFKNTFGYLPKSVGAWWIDSYSQQYLENKYKIKAFLICSDQKTTDKYGIWGQWWGYPYIPSPDNILVPGFSETVVIQWALRDLEKAYTGSGPKVSNFSLQANDYLSQKLDIKYFEKLALQYLAVEKLGQITVGLETGMESMGHEAEYERQLKWLSDNGVTSLKMSEFGDKYREVYNDRNPEKIILEDWVLTPYYRENEKLGEKTVYQERMVFADNYQKDTSDFLNRIYQPENLIRKKIINIDYLIIILSIICGFIFAIKLKIKWWMIFGVGIIVWMMIHVRYSVVNGEKMIGFLVDNFRFVGINFKQGFINTDLSNVVAQSMLKLKL